MEPTAAQTFQEWATGAVAIVTGFAIMVGGLWALWRYVLPAPFAPTWEIEILASWVRREKPGFFRYLVEIKMTNASISLFRITEASFGVFMPGDIASFDKLLKVEPGQLGAIELVDVYPPGVTRRFFAAARTEKLHDMVTVMGDMIFLRRRYLGIIGWRSEHLRIRRSVPVDASSLALYRDSSKENSAD